MTVLIIFTIGSLVTALFGVWLLVNPHQFVRVNALFIKKIYVDGLGIPPQELDKYLKINFFIQAKNKAGLQYFVEQAPHNPHQFQRAIGLFRLFGLMFCTMATLFLGVAYIFYQALLFPPSIQAQLIATPPSFLTVNCLPTIQDNNKIFVDIQIKNISQTTLHIFDSSQMPYLIEQEDDSLLILYGITPVDPTSTYFDVLIPVTKPLQPNQTITDQISLTPLYFGDHYSPPRYQNNPQQRYGSTTVYCQVGWGITPILSPREEKEVRTIYQLLDWQQLSTAKPIEVDFPYTTP